MAVELYDEHEQSERVRNWIKENGLSMVVAVVLAFGGIFGFRQWQDHRAGQQALAAQYYEVIRQELQQGSVEEAASQYEAMVEAVGRSAHAAFAGMALAAAWVEDGRLGAAERIYRDILDNRRLESVWPVATLRLARLLEAQGDTEAALSLVDGPAPDGFAGAWAEVRGDLLYERGRLDEARLAWREALDNQPAEGGNPRLLQLKIDATGPALEDAT